MNTIFYWKYLFSGVMVYLLTRLLVPLNIKLCHKKDWLDYPNERSAHKRPIPVGGGLIFGLVIVLAQIAFGIFFWDFQTNVKILALSMINIMIIVIGLYDDLYNLTPMKKLKFQFLAANLLYIVGFKITVLTNPFGSDLYLGYFGYPLTMLWFVGISNAMNLIDGLDGLSAGITAIAGTTLCLVGLIADNPVVFYLALILVAGNLAFLHFNFNPAKIFMGDAGSLFNGFNLAVLSVTGLAQFKGITAMTIALPVVVMLFPILDTAFTFFRRIAHKKHPFKADNQHIHHKLLRLGLSQKDICYIAYFLTSMFGLLAIGFYFSSKKVFLLGLIILICLTSFFGLLLLNSISKSLKKIDNKK